MKSFIKHFLIIVCLSFSVHIAQGQEDLGYPSNYEMQQKTLKGVDVDLGIAIPVGGASSLYPIGLNATIGPKFAFFSNKKLRIKPLIGVMWLTKPLDTDNFQEMQHFRSLKSGIEFHYQLAYKKLFIYPTFKVDYNWSSDLFSYTDGDGNQNFEKPDAHGNGISKEFGFRLQSKDYYVRIAYEHYRPLIRPSRDINSEQYIEPYIPRDKRAMAFNTIILSIGYDIFIR